VFSAFALLFSLVNAYYSFFRRGVLKADFGEVLHVQVNLDGYVRFTPEITLFNPGTTLAVTKGMEFRLVKVAEDSREDLQWTENVTTVFVDKDGSRYTRFESYPSVMFIPGGQAISKRVALVTVHPIQLRGGDYEIGMTIRSEGTSRPRVSTITRIRLTEDDIRFLTENKVGAATDVKPMLLLFFRRGKNTNCYLNGPGSR
jgi:hypothetical protein